MLDLLPWILTGVAALGTAGFVENWAPSIPPCASRARSRRPRRRGSRRNVGSAPARRAPPRRADLFVVSDGVARGGRGGARVGRLSALILSHAPDWPSVADVASVEALAFLVWDPRCLASGALSARRSLRASGAPSQDCASRPWSLAAPILWTGALDALSEIPAFRIYYDSYAVLQLAALAALALALIAGLPWIVRLAIPTQTLPAGPLRSAFEGIAVSLGVRVRDFRVARTRYQVSNAALLGGFGARTVLLTDRLLREHPADELVAVVGHELGHARGRHMTTFDCWCSPSPSGRSRSPRGFSRRSAPPAPSPWSPAYSWHSSVGSWSRRAPLRARRRHLRLARGRDPRADSDLARADRGARAPVEGELAPSVGRGALCNPRARGCISQRSGALRARAAPDPLDLWHRRHRRIVGIRRRAPRRAPRRAGRGCDPLRALRPGARDRPRPPGPSMEKWDRLANAAAATGVAGPDTVLERARAAFARGEYDKAALLGRVAALRTGRSTDSALRFGRRGGGRRELARRRRGDRRSRVISDARSLLGAAARGSPSRHYAPRERAWKPIAPHGNLEGFA